MTWGLRLQVIFMRPLCHDSPPVLDPCLLGGRMLAAGRHVKNGPIGLEQPRESLPARVIASRERQQARGVAGALPPGWYKGITFQPTSPPQGSLAWSCRGKKLAAVPSLLPTEINPDPRDAVAMRPGFQQNSSPAPIPHPSGSDQGAGCWRPVPIS
jgi:hypothetical protein